MPHYKPVELQHDAFARRSLYRFRAIHAVAQNCDWCGNGPGRFQYHWVADDKRTPDSPTTNKSFCCVDCWRSYYQ